MRYSLLLHNVEPAAGEVPAEVVAEFQLAFARYATSLSEAGVLVSAEILQASSVTRTLRRQEGRLRVLDGPFAETKEQLAGIFVLEVDGLEAAIAWAEACPGLNYGTIEVRPSAIVFREGAWRPST